MPDVIIIANKYHADSGFQIDPDYSRNAIKLSSGGTVANVVFVPKSVCTRIKLKAIGGFEVRIQRWFCEKDENREFFKTKL